ncbi:hypothetical protein H2136_20215 [Aeromonas hydrophila]|uniref:Uncharacterized protein n=1 Tax=Aeromonas hydrophila TaxID=644 RepID=A0A926IYE0_AERHY|nr:hypothetical protein [Aeromonas hydrophila]
MAITNSNSAKDRSTGSEEGMQPGDYRDVWKEERNNAFTVAKMLNADLLVEVGPGRAGAGAGPDAAQFRRSSNRSW